MQINKKSNQLMVLLNIVNITLTVFISIQIANKILLNDFTYYILHGLDEIAYIITLLYLVGVLYLINESRSIQAPFLLILGLEIIMFISSFLPVKQQDAITTMAIIGVIRIILIVYTLITTFKIKDNQLVIPFKMLALSWLLVIILKISIPFIWVITSDQLPIASKYIGLLDVLPLLVIQYIIFKTGKYLGNYKKRS